MTVLRKITSRFFSQFSVKKKEQRKPRESYMDTQEFKDAVFKAVKEGAKDQERFMKSVGASWD